MSYILLVQKRLSDKVFKKLDKPHCANLRRRRQQRKVQVHIQANRSHDVISAAVGGRDAAGAAPVFRATSGPAFAAGAASFSDHPVVMLAHVAAQRLTGRENPLAKNAPAETAAAEESRASETGLLRWPVLCPPRAWNDRKVLPQWPHAYGKSFPAASRPVVVGASSARRTRQEAAA
ncbi:tRNA (guanine-N(1)-)-methyltransferase [Striga asiatica]|uniref:tRNA (Guanine-N(1)-)-methyltransferase n=1 Tax=Striga asiatica TaxID=4170 RepID=A0A5A7QC72_STRAF|nr:tRNA (guanine-N(1)-)-methyltransferase [Striga asiatica]